MVRGGRGGRGSRNSGRDFDNSRFSSIENQQWFDTHSANPILVERSVSNEVNEALHLRDSFDNLGWGNILNLPQTYYPTLVKEFFANIENKATRRDGELHSFVRGVHIVLDREILANILDVFNEGPSFKVNKEIVTSDRSYSFREAKERLGILNHQKGQDRWVYLVKDLAVKHRLLVYLFTFNVIPRASSWNELRFSDIYFLYKMVYGLGNVTGIPLPSIILSHIRDVAGVKKDKRAFCFPLLLSRVFQAFDVPLADVPPVTTTLQEMVTDNTMIRLKFHKVDGVWTKLRVGEERQRHPRHIDDERVEEEAEFRVLEDAPLATHQDIPSTSAEPSNDSEILQHLRDIRATQLLMWEHQQQMQAQLDRHEEILKRLDNR